MGSALKTRRGDKGQVLINFEDYGKITKTAAQNLNTKRESLAAAKVGNYALFAGGYAIGNVYTDEIDSYNTNLVRGSAKLSVGRSSLTGVTLVNGGISYALFCGGIISGGTTCYSTVDAYNSSLTRSTPTELSVARAYLAATEAGNYALLGGGLALGSSKTVVDAYNSSLARSTPTELSIARANLAAAGNYFYGLFGGGTSGSSTSAVVDAYNYQLTRSTPASLSVARRNLAATNNGPQTLFGGGNETYSGYAASSAVDVYDSNLIKGTSVYLSEARQHLAAASGGDYALFGGGYASLTKDGILAKVDAFENKTLIHKSPVDLGAARHSLSAIDLANTVLFAGGRNSVEMCSFVDAYQMNYDLEVQLYKGSTYKFQNMSDEVRITENISTIRIPTPVTGYIKFKKATLS